MDSTDKLLNKKYQDLFELYKKGEFLEDKDLKNINYDFKYKELIPYPQITDLDFNKKLYAKKEFNRNKSIIEDTSDFDKISNQKCSQTTFTMSGHQKLIKTFMSPLTPYNSLLLYFGVGIGKCHALNTPILMYDGSIRYVQDVNVGELVMGDDSTPRTVLSTGTGIDNMYDIIDQYDNSYTVNSEHILCLLDENQNHINIEVKDYLLLPVEKQNKLKGYRTCVVFPIQKVKEYPYEIGYNIIKTIPDNYKINSYEIRIQTLAGIIDRYATITKNAYVFSINLHFEKDLLFLARSLGLCAYIKDDKLYIIGILSIIPTKHIDKPNDTYETFISDIKVVYNKVDEYYGFTLDGNHKYILGNFVVTHNTCTAISIAEQYQTVYQKKVLVILSSTLVDNFKKQIFDITKYNMKENEANLCLGTKYPDMVMDRQLLTPEALEKRVNNIIKERYKFMGYKELAIFMDKLELLANEQQRDPKRKELAYIEKVKQHFSDRLIIIDEAHNLRVPGETGKKQISEAFLKLMKHVQNVKLVLLTATPMFNESTEIIWTMNLLLTNDRRPTLKKIDMFDKENEITEKGKVLLIEASRGYVSFMRGENPFSFPFRLYPNIKSNSKYPEIDIYGKKIKTQIKFLEIVKSNMSDYQKKIYDIFKNKFTKEGELIDDNDDDLDDLDDDNVNNNDLKNTMQVSNVVYPYENIESINNKITLRKTYGKGGFENCFTYSKKKYEYKKNIKEAYGEFLNYDKIKEYAPKIKTILDYVISSKGIVFIYSRYYPAGLMPLAIALEHIGLTKYNGKNISNGTVDNKFGTNKYKYIILSRRPELSPNNDLEIAAAKLNENLNGEIIKVIIVSRIGTEGLDFKRIREVHLLEPWFNLNRAEQIIGRAVRNCSHALLPKEKRNVTIYFHANCYSEKEESADLRTYRVAESKQKRIMDVESILKENALDCNLNKDALLFEVNKLKTKFDIETSQGKIIKNYEVGDKDNSFICSFKKCKIKCTPELSNNIPIDDTTNDEYFIIDDINLYKKYISLIYKINNKPYTFKELFNIIKEQYLNIEEDIFIIALEDMIKEEYPIYNLNSQKYGYLIHRGNKYFFQFYSIKDIRIPIDERVDLNKQQRLKLDTKLLINKEVMPTPTPANKEEYMDILYKVKTQYIEYRNSFIEVIIDNSIVPKVLITKAKLSNTEQILKKYLEKNYKNLSANLNIDDYLDTINNIVSEYDQFIMDCVIDRLNAIDLIQIINEVYNVETTTSKLIKKSLKDWMFPNSKPTHFFNQNNKILYHFNQDNILEESSPMDRNKDIDEKYKLLKILHIRKKDKNIKGFVEFNKDKTVYKIRDDDNQKGAVCGTSQTLEVLEKTINELDNNFLKTKNLKLKKKMLCFILELLQRKSNIFDRKKN
jgi:hypothetical protein